ncbi:MAG: phosphate acyltransferase PlsX [Firmicutes bacterium]|nr:phosphate acyltransferase PlsX [Candidatus Caballimonas caccae]
MYNILVDAFGGDNSPEQVIIGAVSALNEDDNFKITFVGKEDKINEILSSLSFDKNRVSVLNADEVITCEEEPTLAVRRKANSSICVAMKALKEDDNADAFVSAGSTGAVLVGATLRLGRINGVSRPALCPILPTIIDGKNVLLLDSGANADCKAINLLQFAIMGSIFSKSLGVENPKVALLSNGTEDEKGNILNHEVFPLLKENKEINFVGNIEARDVLTGDVDVIVADGFSGNIALKSIEGGTSMLLKLLKKDVFTGFKGKLCALLLMKKLKKMKKTMDYNNKGGAIFLGANKLVIKAHGSSKANTIKNTVLQAVNYCDKNIVENIKEKIASTNLGNEQ